MTMQTHGRDFRPMTASDILSAHRGLQMSTLDNDGLRQLIEHHSAQGAFASKVIQEAAERELDRRWVNGA